MPDIPRRRLIDRFGAAPTFIAEGSTIAGNLETTGPLVVCGTVRGDAIVAGPVRLAATAVWTGDIRAQAAVIAGHVTGRISIEDRLEISASARIEGDLTARTIAIARGAIIDGAVNVTGDQAPVSFEERRREP